MLTESSSKEYAREIITKQSSSTLIVLTEGDILSICERLNGVRNDWFALGLTFRLKYSVLRSIEHRYRSNKHCLTEMVGQWVQQFPDTTTWPYICECLRSPIVERNDVAEEIEGKVFIIIFQYCMHLG